SRRHQLCVLVGTRGEHLRPPRTARGLGVLGRKRSKAMDTELAAMPIIDIDTHYTEPHDLWTSRAPHKLRDLAPRVATTQEANDQWVVGARVLGPPGFTVVRKDGSKVYGVISLPRFADMSVAATQAEARLQYMDEFGLHTQILYPNVLGFAGNNMMKIT